MYSEMKDKKIFYQAEKYAFEYADKAWNRNVFPAKEALDNLSVFEEPLQEFTSEPKDVINMLHQYGSPATISQIGGRYFGLVNGGVIPKGLAAKWLNDFWDQNTPLYVTSPCTSKLEVVIISNTYPSGPFFQRVTSG